MKVLAAVDASINAELALQSLVGMNLTASSVVKLFMAVKNDSAQSVIDGGQQLLQRLKEELQKSLACDVLTEVVKGDARTCVVDAASVFAADFILIGSRGHKGMERLVLGSVSQDVLSRSPCPILIVKTGDTAETVQKGFKRVLLAADNSEYTQAALSWLLKFSWSADTSFKLITVVPLLAEAFETEQATNRLPQLMHEHELGKSLAEAELAVIETVLKDHFEGATVVKEVGEGSPGEVILTIAAAWNADLIVLGSHGRTGLKKLFLGSVSQAVAIDSECAVAIVRGVGPKGQVMQQTGRFKKPTK